jgi:hypothetical protein
VIIGATDAGFGAGGCSVTKPKLRSQNVAFAFLPMPAGMVSLSKKVVDFVKRVLGCIHELKW